MTSRLQVDKGMAPSSILAHHRNIIISIQQFRMTSSEPRLKIPPLWKQMITRHDCALCKGTSEVRRKHLLKWRSREGHHYLKLALAILLTKFGNHSAKFTTFDLWWPLTFMKVIAIINLHQGFFLTKFGNQSATFTTFDLWWPLTFMKVIIIINLHQGFFWLSLVAIAHSFRIWPLMTFDLHEGHHHHKLASEILLTKFGSHST